MGGINADRQKSTQKQFGDIPRETCWISRKKRRKAVECICNVSRTHIAKYYSGRKGAEA